MGAIAFAAKASRPRGARAWNPDVHRRASNKPLIRIGKSPGNKIVKKLE